MVTPFTEDGALDEAASRRLARHLVDMGAKVRYHDPYVYEWNVEGTVIERATDLLGDAATADITVLVQNHKAYDLKTLASAAHRLLDTRGKIDEPGVERL